MYDSNVIMETLLQRASAELHRNERAYWRSVQRQCDERTLKCVREIEIYLQDRGINVEAIYKDNDDDETNANNNIDHISSREEQSNSCEESGENNSISTNKNGTFIYKNAKSEQTLSATVMKDNFNTTPAKNYNESAEKSKQVNKYKIDDAKRSNANLEPLIEHISYRAQSNAHSSNHSAFTLPYAGTCTDDIVVSINDIISNTNLTNSKTKYKSEDAEDEKCELPFTECDPEQLLNAVEEFGPMLSSVTDTISTTERNGIYFSEEQMSEQNWQNCRSHDKVNNKTGKPLPSLALTESEQQEELYEQSPSSQEYSEQQQYHESTSPLLQLVSLEREEDEEQKKECRKMLKKNVKHESTNKCANNNYTNTDNNEMHNNNLVAAVDGNKQLSSGIDSVIPIASAINDVIESTHSSELNSPHRSFSLHFTSPPTHHVERTSHHAHLNVPSTYTSSNSSAKTSKESEELTIEHSVPEDSSEVPWIGDQSHVTRTWSVHDTCQSLLKLPEVIDVSNSALITSHDAEMYTNTTSNVQCNRQAHEENNNKTPRGSAKLHDIMQSMERVLMRFTDECHEDSESACKTSNNCHLEIGKVDDITNDITNHNYADNRDGVQSNKTLEQNVNESNIHYYNNNISNNCNTKKRERRSGTINNFTENVLPQCEKLKPLKIHTENSNNNHSRSNQEPYSSPTSSSHSSPLERHEQSSEGSYSSMYREKLHQMLLLFREKPQRYQEVLKRREVMSRMQTVLQNHHLHKLESAHDKNETNLHESNAINFDRENALVSSGNALVISEDTRDKVREVTSSLTKLIKLTSQVRRANEKNVKEYNYKDNDEEMEPQSKEVTNGELLANKLNTYIGQINTAESMQLTVSREQQGNMERMNSGANANVLKTIGKTLESKAIIAKPKESSKGIVQDRKSDEVTMRKDNRHINNHTSLIEMLGFNNIANNNSVIDSNNSKSLCERLIAHNSYEEMAIVPQNARKNRPHELFCKVDKYKENKYTKTMLLQGENDERNCHRNCCYNTQLGLQKNVSDLTSSLVSPSPRRPSTSL